MGPWPGTLKRHYKLGSKRLFTVFQNSLDSLTFEKFWKDNIEPSCFEYIKNCFKCFSTPSNENLNLIKQALEESITPCLAFFDVYSDSFLIVTLVQAMGGIFLGLQHISTLNVLQVTKFK
jgi:hypothetical protein